VKHSNLDKDFSISETFQLRIIPETRSRVTEPALSLQDFFYYGAHDVLKDMHTSFKLDFLTTGRKESFKSLFLTNGRKRTHQWMIC
jgi:hypothetical protein